MEKKVIVEGKEIRLKTSGALPRVYRIAFQRDIFKDLNSLAYITDEDLVEAETGEVLENIAYAMAKHADPKIPDTVEEWLEQFEDPRAVTSMLDDVLELWHAENKEDSTSKKESEK